MISPKRSLRLGYPLRLCLYLYLWILFSVIMSLTAYVNVSDSLRYSTVDVHPLGSFGPHIKVGTASGLSTPVMDSSRPLPQSRDSRSRGKETDPTLR